MFHLDIFYFLFLLDLLFAKPTILLEQDLAKAQLFSNSSVLKDGIKEWRWVCTKHSDKILIECDDLGINELEGEKRELQINIKSKNYAHEYGLRHGILKRECERIKNGINELLSKNKTACFRGQFVSTNLDSNPAIVEWVFDEAKSSGENICEFNGCD